MATGSPRGRLGWLLVIGACLVGLAQLAKGAIYAMYAERPPARPDRPMLVGYFHGGRTNLFYRAYVTDKFEKEGAKIDLSTRNLYNSEYTVIPKSWEDAQKDMDQVTMGKFGKVTGVEIIRQIVDGHLDGGMVGESSFLQEIERGAPIVAVATLGHDTREMPGHCILFRSGVRVRNAQDMKGLIFSSRRAGPGDELFLREFLVQQGLDPDRDVSIQDGVSDALQEHGLIDGTFDGGYYHLMSAVPLVTQGKAYLYRPLNWVPADLSLALLVYHKDYVATHKDEIVKVIKVYLHQIDAENQLPREERVKRRKKGAQIAESFLGMNYPQCDIPPVVSLELLTQVQGLLVKHKFLKGGTPIAPYIDNTYVNQATREAGFPSDGSYKRVSP